jgi:phage-related minor tail protein
MTDTVASLSVRVGAETSDAKQKLKELEKLGDAFGKRISGAFEDAVFSGESFSQTLRSLALDLARLSLRGALQPLTGALGDAFSNAIGGSFGFAKGGVVGTAMAQPFADGGVIASPISFPLSGGRTGIAGEAGPEAIIPLARGADGRLGVRTNGQGSGPVSITFNITTPDADSFRRSEGQIAAMLSRTVARGQRNL